MDGIGRSRGWDKEIQHDILPMEQLFLSDKWARKLYSKFSFGEVYRRNVYQRASASIKHDFRPYIRQYTSPIENFEYCNSYPHSNVILQYGLKLEPCGALQSRREPHVIQRNAT